MMHIHPAAEAFLGISLTEAAQGSGVGVVVVWVVVEKVVVVVAVVVRAARVSRACALAAGASGRQ
jgi:hypothetical protein